MRRPLSRPITQLTSLHPLPFHLPFHRACTTSTQSESTSLASENKHRAHAYLETYGNKHNTHPTDASPLHNNPHPFQKRIPPLTGAPLPPLHTLESFLTDNLGGENIQRIDVKNKAPFADMMLVCTGRSERHVEAIAGGLKREMRELGVSVGGEEVGICGVGGWRVVDLGAIVVHVMTAEERLLYALEDLWADRGGG